MQRILSRVKQQGMGTQGMVQVDKFEIKIFKAAAGISCLLFLICPAAFAEGLSTEFYGQNVYRTDFNNFVTQNRLRVFQSLSPKWRAYGGAAWEDDTRTRKDFILNDNFAAPLAGLEFRLGEDLPSLFTEFRLVLRGRDRPPQRKSIEGDFRLGLFAYYFWSQEWSGKLRAFQEIYSDAYFTSKIAANGYASVWAKAGPSLLLAKFLRGDAFLEASGKLDARAFSGERSAELRSGLRALFFTEGASLSLQGDRNLLFAGELRYRSEWRALAALGMVF